MDLIENLKRKIKSFQSSLFGDDIKNLRSEMLDKLEEIENTYFIELPHGYGLEPDLEKDWIAYKENYDQLKKTLFEKYEKQINKIIDEFKPAVNKNKEKYEDEKDYLDRLIEKSAKKIKDENRKTLEIAENCDNDIKKIIKEIYNNFNEDLKSIQIKYKNKKKLSTDDLAIIRNDLISITNKYKTIFKRVIVQLQENSFFIDDEGYVVSTLDLTEAREEELYSLKDSLETEFDLVQLGSAVNIIHHEFNMTVRAIRLALKNLRKWADVNEPLRRFTIHLKIVLIILTVI